MPKGKGKGTKFTVSKKVLKTAKPGKGKGRGTGNGKGRGKGSQRFLHASLRRKRLNSVRGAEIKQCRKRESGTLTVSLRRGWADIIKNGISDHLPMMFSVEKQRNLAAPPDIFCWNILKQCRTTRSGTNNGFNTSETPKAYFRRLAKIGQLVGPVLDQPGAIVVLQECPATGTAHFDALVASIAKHCSFRPRYVSTPIDSSMSLVTLWNDVSWSLTSSTKVASGLLSRAVACFFESRDGEDTMCVVNVHVVWGGPTQSPQRKKHTINLAEDLSACLQGASAKIAVAVGDFNLQVDTLHDQLKPFSKFHSANLIGSSQMVAGGKPHLATVDGAVLHLADGRRR